MISVADLPFHGGGGDFPTERSTVEGTVLNSKGFLLQTEADWSQFAPPYISSS